MYLVCGRIGDGVLSHEVDKFPATFLDFYVLWPLRSSTSTFVDFYALWLLRCLTSTFFDFYVLWLLRSLTCTFFDFYAPRLLRSLTLRFSTSTYFDFNFGVLKMCIVHNKFNGIDVEIRQTSRRELMGYKPSNGRIRLVSVTVLYGNKYELSDHV
jgi:hypothetical protein